MPSRTRPDLDTLALGQVFPALATHPRHGQVVWLTDCATIDRLAAC